MWRVITEMVLTRSDRMIFPRRYAEYSSWYSETVIYP